MTVRAGGNTGLAENDVFYFGNAIGECGSSAGDTRVNATDMLAARNHPRTFIDPPPIDFYYDYDRDARVNATDMLIARNNQTSFLDALKLITVPPIKAVGQGETEISQLPAHDAVLEQFAAGPSGGRESASGKLNWLYEFEQIRTPQRPSPQDNTAEKVLDKLLADDWQ